MLCCEEDVFPGSRIVSTGVGRGRSSLSDAHQTIGYQNYQFPLGSTNVEPIVLSMKSAGINGLNTSIVTNSNLAIVTGLNQQGIHPVNVLATGYGGDLIQGGAGASVQAQDSYFITGAEPVELNTSATKQFQSALATYSGVHGIRRSPSTTAISPSLHWPPV